MSDNGWSQSWPHDDRSATGVAAALEGYASLGGRLLGARRWAPNPLTLTHVRWMGPRGETSDAVRQPGDDQGLSDAEREVWVQLALGFPAMHPSPAGHDAPWLPLAIAPEQAANLLARLPRAAFAPRAPRLSYDPGSGGDSGVASATRTPPPNRASGGQARGPVWNSDLRDAVLFDEGVSVLPCVEIELPPVAGLVTADASRAFVRDAAAAFVRATRGLRQVREIRGWMRGGRLVLAVRLTIAPGSGAPTREEEDDAMRALAYALAQQTLPYAQLTTAHPGEWARGQVFSE